MYALYHNYMYMYAQLHVHVHSNTSCLATEVEVWPTQRVALGLDKLSTGQDEPGLSWLSTTLILSIQG